MESRQFRLQDAATTGNGAVWDGTNQATQIAVYVDWSAGVSAGAVTIETANSTTYSGTWAPLAVVVNSAASKQDVFHFTGPLMAVRARVTTTVAGGTVSCLLVGRPN